METRSRKRAESTAQGPLTRGRLSRLRNPRNNPPRPPAKRPRLTSNSKKTSGNPTEKQDKKKSSVGEAGSAAMDQEPGGSFSGDSKKEKLKQKMEREAEHKKEDSDRLWHSRDRPSSTSAAGDAPNFTNDGDAGILHHNLTSASTALSGLLKKLGAGLDDLLPSTASMSMQSSRIKSILSGLRAQGDGGRQIESLTQLCEILSISTEESLSNFSVDAFAPVLVNLLSSEHNPDIMLLSARALTNLCEVLPSSCAAVVHYGAVPLFCARLLTIEYIDLAEQSLQALLKISHEHPLACLQAGALMAVLSYLDFFSTGVQRVAVTIAANICRQLPADSHDLLNDAVPILTNLLQYHDAKVVNQACIAFMRITHSFSSSPERLDTLCTSSVLPQVLKLVSDSHTVLTPATYTGMIKMLSVFAGGSSSAAEILFHLNISSVLKNILVGNTLPSSSSSSSSMFSTFDKSPEQLFEIVTLVNELLPPLKDKSSESNVVKPLRRRSSRLNSSENDASKLENDVSNSQSTASPTAREKLFLQESNLLLRFGTDLLPILIQIYGSTVNPLLRYKCLAAIAKILHFSSSDTLHDLLKESAISSFLSGVLATKDALLMLESLQIAEILMQKLPSVFFKSFVKEGVVHAIQTFVDSEQSQSQNPNPIQSQNQSQTPTPSQSQTPPKPDSSSKKLLLSSQTSPQTSRSWKGPFGRRKSSSSSNPAKDSSVNEGDASPSPSLSPSPSPAAASLLPPAANYASAMDAAKSSKADLKKMVLESAKKFLERHFSSHSGYFDGGLTDKLKELKEVCLLLEGEKGLKREGIVFKDEKCLRKRREEDMELLNRLFSLICNGEGVSTFEFIGSGVVHALMEFFSYSADAFVKECTDDQTLILKENVKHRLHSFVLVAFPSPSPSSPSDTSLSSSMPPVHVFIRKLHDALASTERFPVLLSKASQTSNVGLSVSAGLAALSQPLKLRLSRSPLETELKDYSSNVVLIEPLATLSAIEEFLWPRVKRMDPPSTSAAAAATMTASALTSGIASDDRLVSMTRLSDPLRRRLSDKAEEGEERGREKEKETNSSVLFSNSKNDSSASPFSLSSSSSMDAKFKKSTTSDASPSFKSPLEESNVSKKGFSFFGDESKLKRHGVDFSEFTVLEDDDDEDEDEMGIEHGDEDSMDEDEEGMEEEEEEVEEEEEDDGGHEEEEEDDDEIFGTSLPSSTPENVHDVRLSTEPTDQLTPPKPHTLDPKPTASESQLPIHSLSDFPSFSFLSRTSSNPPLPPNATSTSSNPSRETPADSFELNTSQRLRQSFADALAEMGGLRTGIRERRTFSSLLSNHSTPKLSFFIGNKPLDRNMTVYQCIQKQFQSEMEEEGMLQSSEMISSSFSSPSSRKTWDDVFTITYANIDSQTKNTEPADASKPHASLNTCVMSEDKISFSDGYSWQSSQLVDFVLSRTFPRNAGEKNVTHDILLLLRILHDLNQSVLRMRAESSIESFIHNPASSPSSFRQTDIERSREGDALLIPADEFSSKKLSSKLARQLQDVLSICSCSFPSWCSLLSSSFSFLFPFELRKQYFYSTAFGVSRALHRLQQQQVAEGTPSPSEPDSRTSRVGRIPKQKVRVSRNRILDSAVKVMELYGSNDSILEVEYFGEAGTGLGPTLEFYTLLSQELQKKSLHMWRTDVHVSDDKADVTEGHKKTNEYVFSPHGLFPRPYKPLPTPCNVIDLSEEEEKEKEEKEKEEKEKEEKEKDKRQEKLMNLFKFLGRVLAKAVQDNRLLDIHFSKSFQKIILGKELDLFDIKSFDPELGNFLEEMSILIRKRKSIMRENRHNIDDSKFLYKETSLDDLCLDFTLPGYPEYELKPNGPDVQVTWENVEEWVSLVVDATVKNGIASQLHAFKSGFNQVFSLSSLQIFNEDELDSFFCGYSKKWNMDLLLENIKCDHGYTKSSAPIQNLFEIMSELNANEQREFVRFVTGAPRLPAGGFASLNPKFTIVRKHPSGAAPSNNPNSSSPSAGISSSCSAGTMADGDLPSVMTCANYLKLPPYSSKTVMRERLMYAIKEGQGSFDLS